MTTGAGEFDRQITIVRLTTTLVRAVPTTTATILAQVSAQFEPVTGTEKYATDETIPMQDANFMIRWSPDVKDVRAKDQIQFQENVTDNPRNWDITSIQLIGLRRFISIRARLLNAND